MIHPVFSPFSLVRARALGRSTKKEDLLNITRRKRNERMWFSTLTWKRRRKTSQRMDCVSISNLRASNMFITLTTVYLLLIFTNSNYYLFFHFAWFETNFLNIPWNNRKCEFQSVCLSYCTYFLDLCSVWRRSKMRGQNRKRDKSEESFFRCHYISLLIFFFLRLLLLLLLFLLWSSESVCVCVCVWERERVHGVWTNQIIFDRRTNNFEGNSISCLYTQSEILPCLLCWFSITWIIKYTASANVVVSTLGGRLSSRWCPSGADIPNARDQRPSSSFCFWSSRIRLLFHILKLNSLI